MKIKKKSKAITKQKCEAKTELCRGVAVSRFGVNGSEKEGKTFRLCMACLSLLRMAGHKLKQV